jgi:hypothetical protein
MQPQQKSNKQWQFGGSRVQSNNKSLPQLVKRASFTLSTHLQVPSKCIKSHNDCWKNWHFPVLTSSRIHLPVSVRATFTDERSLNYKIQKRTTKANCRGRDIDREESRSLKMVLILTGNRHVQSLHTISQHPDELQQQKLAHCIRNRLVDSLVQ